MILYFLVAFPLELAMFLAGKATFFLDFLCLCGFLLAHDAFPGGESHKFSKT